jgi:CHAP domain
MSQAGWPWGQCTWYVAGFFNLPFGGDAWQWAQNARAAGWSEVSMPQPGDIAVYQPGHAGALRAGHVAVVTDVTGNQYTVSEMNYDGLGRVDSRTITYRPGDATFIDPPASAQIQPALQNLLGGKTASGGPVSSGTGTASLTGSTTPGSNVPILGGALGFVYQGAQVVIGAALILFGIWSTLGRPGGKTVVELAGLTAVGKAVTRPAAAVRERQSARAAAGRADERAAADAAAEDAREARELRRRQLAARYRRPTRRERVEAASRELRRAPAPRRPSPSEVPF